MWLHSVHLCHVKSLLNIGQYWPNLRSDVSDVFLRNTVALRFPSHMVKEIGEKNFIGIPMSKYGKSVGKKRPFDCFITSQWKLPSDSHTVLNIKVQLTAGNDSIGK